MELFSRRAGIFISVCVEEEGTTSNVVWTSSGICVLHIASTAILLVPQQRTHSEVDGHLRLV